MSYASDALIDAQKREIERLKTENDRLRSSLKLDESTIGILNACMDDLNAENFKLRELARKNWHIAMSERYTLDSVRAYDNMSMDPEEYVKAIDTELDKARSRMCELGIEVR